MRGAFGDAHLDERFLRVPDSLLPAWFPAVANQQWLASVWR